MVGGLVGGRAMRRQTQLFVGDSEELSGGETDSKKKAANMTG